MPNTVSLNLTLTLSGATETLKAFKDLPPDATVQMRDAALLVSNDMVGWIADAARADSPQAAALVPTIRANRDRIPNVTVGGAKRVTSRGVKAFLILFGANFGAVTYRTPGRVPYFVHDHAGPGRDYWIWATAEDHMTEIDDAWNAAADAVLEHWSKGGEE